MNHHHNMKGKKMGRPTGRVVKAKATGTEESVTTEFQEGDVVIGRFACRVERPRPRTAVLVTGKVPDGSFYGDSLVYETGHGYGSWGYANEVEEVRPGTPKDRADADNVKERVRRDTERMLARGGAPA